MRSRRVVLAVLPAALVVIVLGWLGLAWWNREATRGPEGHGRGASQIPAVLFDEGTTWLQPSGDRPFVAGGRATVLMVWNMTEPASLAALERAAEWSRAYAAHGVTVVGVHAPRYAFDADSAVVARELLRRGVGFPVALDSDLETTRRLAVASELPWILAVGPRGDVALREHDPTLVQRWLESLVLDGGKTARGRGRGDGATSGEKRGADGRGGPSHDPAAGAGPDAAGDGRPLAIELGAAFARRGPLADVTPGRPRRFHAQFRHEIEGEPHVPVPVGLWTPGADGITAARGGADNFVALRYDPGPLAVVMSPPGSDTRVWVLGDDRWLAPEDAGDDVRFDGRGASFVEVTSSRLYQVCRSGSKVRSIKLSPDDPGLTVHAFRLERVASTER